MWWYHWSSSSMGRCPKRNQVASGEKNEGSIKVIVKELVLSRVVAMSLPLQIAFPAKGAPKYTILGCLLSTGALYIRGGV